MNESPRYTFFRRYKDLLVVLFLLALPLVFFISNSKETREYNIVDKVVVLISAPIQWAVVSTIDGVSTLWHDYVALRGVQADNDSLLVENARLRALLHDREEQRLENERLRLLVGQKERAPTVQMIYGEIIATAPTPLFRAVRVDKGERDGVRLGAAVLSSDGVVGRVAAVTDASADVMLIVDANSSLDVLVQRTRARARVRGTGADAHLGIQVEFLARTADVEPGDVIITSGTGTVFPKGLVVGTVMAVERAAFGLYQRAEVEPSVDFGRLEGVMIITGTWDEGATTFEERRPSAGASGVSTGESPAPLAPLGMP